MSNLTNTSNKFTVSPIPAFTDNYIWLITSKNSQLATLVDPGNAEVCIEYLNKHKLQLNRILITHYHFDHVGGINKLKDYCVAHGWPLTIFGPAFSELPNADKLPIPKKHYRDIDVTLNEGDKVTLEEFDLTFNIIAIPGHTLEHIAYYVAPFYAAPIVFCGDTLFSGGCGRIFEGSPTQMLASLKRLAALPDEALVYCAHEYTLSNLQFALQAEPENIELLDYYNNVSELRNKKQISLPTNIKTEKLINPFLRANLKNIQASVAESLGTSRSKNQQVNDELSTFTALREWKNNS